MVVKTPVGRTRYFKFLSPWDGWKLLYNSDLHNNIIFDDGVNKYSEITIYEWVDRNLMFGDLIKLGLFFYPEK